MKVIAYNIRPEEKEWLVLANYKKHDITIIANSLTSDTLSFAVGKEALLVFNNDYLNEAMIQGLKALGIKYIATSSFATDHLDLTAAGFAGIKVANVLLETGSKDPKLRMEQVIKNLDQWAAGKCVGKACCCQNDCATIKALK
ncbi:lactate dehydrogenase [Pedobacter mucosus]|uniref:lactate dehydrogenase n=1 Tax=Pedobacter mucosus TaxID=2895286 RepID=UPI001EE493FF|nr:lactate dehydrogenase [Pedobacter mucosus]UKT64709.1 lactate dehydrogenase [Pedobacter mucosus]